MTLKSRFASLALGVVLCAGVAYAQVEGGNAARVLVPDVPGGAVVTGCYKADRGLYGPYAVSFCLQRKGTYAVRGEGLKCDGRLTWATRGRDVKITVNRARCNGNRAWAEASITCKPRSALDLILSDLLDKRKDTSGRVLVPAPTQVRTLRCVYTPTVAGNRPASFVANRLASN